MGYLSGCCRSALIVGLIALQVGGVAWAQSTSSGGYVDASTVGTLPGPGLNCDSFCAGVVDPSNQQDLSTTGTDGWTSNDDAYCANHGVSTNPNVQANPTVVANANIPCNVPVMTGDTTCSQTNQDVLRCKIHGTQIESHCIAYQTDTGATQAEITLEEYDAAAAATCMTACFAKAAPFGRALEIACSAAGIFASTEEVLKVMALQNSTQKAMYGALGAFGLATSGVALAQGLTGVSAGTSKSGASTPGKRKDSCYAALAMAALAGFRGYNIYKEDNAKTKECTNIQTLLSSSGVSLPGDGSSGTLSTTSSSSSSGTTVVVNPTSSSSSGTTDSSSSSGTVTTGGTSGTIATVVVPTSSDVVATPSTATSGAAPLTVAPGGTRPAANFVGTGKLPTQLAQTAAGLDGSILNGTGLGQAVAPLAQQLANNPVAAGMAASGDAGGLISSGFGNQGAAGNALANVARAAQTLAAAGGFPTGGATYAAAGGGGGGGKAADEENPFAKLAAGAGAGGDAGAGATPSQLGFDKPADPCIDGADIWHTNCHGTIFDVISGRINRSRGKVEQLPWVDPERE